MHYLSVDLNEAKCSIEKNASKEKQIVSAILKEMTSDIFEEGFATCSYISSFKPIYFLSNWFEQVTTTKCFTFIILLPSGIPAGQFSVRQSEDEFALLLTVTWPEPLINLEKLHRKWFTPNSLDRIEMYHLKMAGFEQFSKLCRTRNTASVESTAKIPLPIQVHISGKYNLEWTDSNAGVV